MAWNSTLWQSVLWMCAIASLMGGIASSNLAIFFSGAGFAAAAFLLRKAVVVQQERDDLLWNARHSRSRWLIPDKPH